MTGIASFTILSDQITSARDVATNFFLQPQSIGQSIASECTKYVARDRSRRLVDTLGTYLN